MFRFSFAVPPSLQIAFCLIYRLELNCHLSCAMDGSRPWQIEGLARVEAKAVDVVDSADVVDTVDVADAVSTVQGYCHPYHCHQGACRCRHPQTSSPLTGIVSKLMPPSLLMMLSSLQHMHPSEVLTWHPRMHHALDIQKPHR